MDRGIEDESMCRRYTLTSVYRLVKEAYGKGIAALASVKTSTFNSDSCAGDATDGASVIKHVPDWVFGKAITSRIDLQPAKSMTIRSRPSAIPPCGGAPEARASRRKPNFSLAISLFMPIIENTSDCKS